MLNVPSRKLRNVKNNKTKQNKKKQQFGSKVFKAACCKWGEEISNHL